MNRGNGRASVLVVDDEPSNVDLFTRCLHSEFAVVSAHDGTSALELLKQRSFDVILSDHRMPGMTGVQLLAEAEKLDSVAARVLVTAYGDMEVLAHAVNEARVAYYVRKPWDPEHLREVVRRFARDASKRRAAVTATDGSGFPAPLSSFYQSLRAAFERARQSGDTVGLLCGDIDRLRETNAQAGVEAGDALVRRLIAAAQQVLAGHPAVSSLYQGGRLLAMTEKLSAAALRELGEALRAAYAAAPGSASTLSVGLALYPRDGNEPLSLVTRAEEAVTRSKRLGRNRVAECLPAVVVVGQLSAMATAMRGLASRMDLRLISGDETEASMLVMRERPAVVLAHLLGSRMVLSELATLMKLEELKGTHLILVTSKDPSPAVSARVAPFPGATLLTGKNRLVARTVEAVCQALGVKQRRHLRLSSQVELSVRREYDGSVHKARLMNISESGAKVAIDVPVLAAEVLELRVTLRETPLALAARVMRAFRGASTWELGVEFGELDRAVRAELEAFVGEATIDRREQAAERPREHPRLDAPPKLKLKARLRAAESKATWYLKPLNLSMGGVLLEAEKKFRLELPPGATVELILYGKARAVHADAQVVRRHALKDGRVQLALRFDPVGEVKTSLEQLIGELGLGDN